MNTVSNYEVIRRLYKAYRTKDVKNSTIMKIKISEMEVRLKTESKID